jgi:hypothetical protein
MLDKNSYGAHQRVSKYFKMHFTQKGCCKLKINGPYIVKLPKGGKGYKIGNMVTCQLYWYGTQSKQISPRHIVNHRSVQSMVLSLRI